MFVSRSEVSLRCSIQCDSCETDANAMSSSFDGKGPGSDLLWIDRSRCGTILIPGSIGFQVVAGESVGSKATLRGPVRRSYNDAMSARQLEAATPRSLSVN